MNNKGQMAGYEALIIIVLICVSGWMFYLYAHKPSEAQIFKAGSNPLIRQPHYQSSPFSCVNVKAEEFMEAQRNEVK